MPTQPKPGPSKAALHYQRAEEYRKLAQSMLQTSPHIREQVNAIVKAGRQDEPSPIAWAEMLRAGRSHHIFHTIDADILLASAGALLYEAAKQCVNAVANLNGRDPQWNQEKRDELSTIAKAHPNYPDLMDDSRKALLLHIHADQAHLTSGELAYALERTRRFIADMQRIYRAIAPPP